MKKSVIFVFAAAFGLLLSAKLAVASPPDNPTVKMTDAKATIRSVMGAASYVSPDGKTRPLKVNLELPPGTTITTGDDSQVKASVNGITSAIEIEANSSVLFAVMKKAGSGRSAATETELDVQEGRILGQVKKVSAGSSYTIRGGEAYGSIRGTDFVLDVQLDHTGKPKVTFDSITGTVQVSAPSEGGIQSVILHDGQRCVSFANTVHLESTPQKFLAQFNDRIGVGGSFLVNPVPVQTSSPVAILQPFDGNGPPNPALRSPMRPQSPVTFPTGGLSTLPPVHR